MNWCRTHFTLSIMGLWKLVEHSYVRVRRGILEHAAGWTRKTCCWISERVTRECQSQVRCDRSRGVVKETEWQKVSVDSCLVYCRPGFDDEQRSDVWLADLNHVMSLATYFWMIWIIWEGYSRLTKWNCWHVMLKNIWPGKYFQIRNRYQSVIQLRETVKVPVKFHLTEGFLCTMS